MAASKPTNLPRFWWLKRFAIGGTAAVLLLAGIWCLWFWYAQRTLDREVAKLRAAGRPVSREDLCTRRLPDGQNALIPLRQAMNSSPTVDVPASSAMSFREELPYPPAWHAMMNKAYPAYAGIYPLVRQARLIGQVDHGPFPPTGPILMLAGPRFSQYRQLANVLGDTALYYHFRGEDAAALETISDLLFLSDATAEYPFLMAKLVGHGIRAVAANRLLVIATDIRISSADDRATSMLAGPASRGQAQSLIKTLLHDEVIGQSYASALYEEGVFSLDMINAYNLHILRPAHMLAVAQALAMEDSRGSVIREQSLPTTALRNAQKRPWAIRFFGVGASSRLEIISFRGRMYQRVAAISLATALYRADHGTYPRALNELVPAYLPAVPVDPMSASGAPFGYMIVADGRRPILISAGEDGIMQTKDESFIPLCAMYGYTDTRGRPCDDQYIDLSAWKDPTPPPPEADPLPEDTQPDNGQKPDAPGNDNQPKQAGQQPQTGNGHGDQK